jgi:hypothetical protein
MDAICSCKNNDCPRHGDCSLCVAFHRDEKKNLPVCLRAIAPQ